MARLLPFAQQRAVVRADVHDESAGAGVDDLGLAILDHFREVLVQDARRAAGVGIIRRKEHRRIDDAAQLHQLAMRAEEQFGRIGGLLARPLADRTHLVDWGNIADEQDGLEVPTVAQLAFLDDQAGPGAGGKRRG